MLRARVFLLLFFTASMRKAITTVAAGVLLALSSQPLMAVGFGRLVNATTLGQSLDVSVPLSADTTEQITSDCVSANVVVGDSPLPHPAVRVRLEPAGGEGSRSLRVTTTVRIHEPIVNLTVSVACPSRVSRQFVVFVDPPLTAFEPGVTAATEAPAAPSTPVAAASASPAAALPEPVVTRGEESASGSGALAAPAEQAAPPSARRTARSSASKAASAKAQAARRSQAAARKARRAASIDARARSSAPRLQLERGSGAVSASPLAAAASAADASALAMTAESAASAASAADTEPAAEAQQEAIRSMQQRLDKLQIESEASIRSIAQLQARLQEAQASRSTGWLTYALTAAGAALLLWIGLLIGRRVSASRPGAPWWNADAGPARSGPIPAMKPAFVPSAMAGLPEAVEMSDDTPTTDPVPLVIMDPSPPTAPTRPAQGFGDTAASAGDSPATEPPSAPLPRLTADELIDLDQQAEFFVALGQDDSAVDLLNAFLRGSGGASSLPYLKLLEIHRRRGERDAYERIRERHARRFGTSAAPWGDPAVAARAIEDHAPEMRQIESVWADPPEAMRLIESLLISSDRTEMPFDLSTFADLQFLYLLARSALEFDEAGAEPAVDLLLPLSHHDDPRSVVAAATRSVSNSADLDASVDSGFSRPADIDLELDFLPPRTDPKPLV